MLSFISSENDQATYILAALQERKIALAEAALPTLPSSDASSYLKAYLAFLKKDLQTARYLLKNLTSLGPYYAFALLQNDLQTKQEEELFLHLLNTEDSSLNLYPVLYEIKANTFLQLNKIEEAKSLILYGYKKFPERIEIFLTLITILIHNGEFETAETLLETELKKTPHHPRFLSALASIHNILNKTESCLDLFRHAIMITPHDARLRLNHSIALLKAKRYAQGWSEHEWRFKLPNHTKLPLEKILPSFTRENQGKIFKSKKILVTHEEGFGDVLMYLRYLPILAQYGAGIHVWGSKELSSLTRRVEGVHSVQYGGSVPDYDYHCPFISLPRVFNAHFNPFGASIPYISPDPGKISYWKNRLSAQKNKRYRIGLTWAGGSHKESRSARLMNQQRSTSLKIFSPLAQLSHCDFYSLQKGEGALELKNNPSSFPAPLHNYMDECHTMEDTAALITQLDLVISVDTSIVHLAGAMGHPVFLLNRYTGCWRWGHDDHETPWYPTMRIFKQKQFGQWAPVIEEILQTLQSRFS